MAASCMSTISALNDAYQCFFNVRVGILTKRESDTVFHSWLVAVEPACVQ